MLGWPSWGRLLALGSSGRLRIAVESPYGKVTLRSLVAGRLTAIFLARPLPPFSKSTGDSFACHLHLFKHRLI